MKTKYIIGTVVILLVGQLAAGCSFGPPQDTTPAAELVIWKLFGDSTQMKPVIDAYQKANPKVRVTFAEKDIATYEDDLLNALASGTGPDIFSIHNDWLPRYIDKMVPAPAKLFPAREFESAFVDVARQDLFDAAGSLYAVPFSTDVLALFYNRDLLGSAGIAAPPTTWSEVISDVKKLTRQDKLGNFITNGIAMGTAQNVNRSADILSLLMLQNGTQIFNSARTSSALDREIAVPDGTSYNPGAQALDFYTQFANPAKETYTWNQKNNYSIDAFAGGQAAMMLSYSYIVSTLKTKAPLLNYGIAPVPQIDLAKPKVNYANYFAEGVSRKAAKPDVAWDFLKFATSAEQLKKYYQAGKAPSSRKDIISEQIADADIGVFAEGALTAKTFYKPDASRVEAAFTAAIDDVILRGKSTREAIANTARLLNQMVR